VNAVQELNHALIPWPEPNGSITLKSFAPFWPKSSNRRPTPSRPPIPGVGWLLHGRFLALTRRGKYEAGDPGDF
jgi:hypothetical protein